MKAPSVGDRSGKDGQTGKENTQPEAPPDSLEVQLSSIIVGPNRRIALINGRPYQEGKSLIFTKDGHQWEFHLQQVLPNAVILQWNDRRYEVKLPRTPSNVEIQLESLGNWKH